MSNIDPNLLVEQHELCASLDEMLAPRSLSAKLNRPVRTVERALASGVRGTTSNPMEWVTLDGEERPRYLLKHLVPQSDWVMQASQDNRCRSVRLWQYGLLDRVLPWLDHTLVTCAYEGDGWALLMRDVSAGLFPSAGPWNVPQTHQLLDALAHLHATFWGKRELMSPELGLTGAATHLETLSVPTAQRLAHRPDWVFGVLLEGWELIQAQLDPEALEIYRELMLKPEPLLAALEKYPFTLLHGDFRDGMHSGGNIGILPGEPSQVCAFDWQMASYNLCTVDLAWFANRSETVRRTLAPDQSSAYYGERLEHYLGRRFERSQWQAMLELGYLVDTLRMGCVMTYFSVRHDNEANRAWLQAEVKGYSAQIRAGARWL